MTDIIEKYRRNYIKEMRKLVGHAPLMGNGCGVIIENEKGEILLQKGLDNGCWALIGGAHTLWRCYGGREFSKVAQGWNEGTEVLVRKVQMG